MSHVIYLLSPREKESESEPDWSPRTQSTSTYVAIVRLWSISSLVRAIFIEKHLTLRGACLMNARRCRSSSRWGYNSAHKCGRRTRICKVRLQFAFCTRTWQAFHEVWRWFPKLPSWFHPRWGSCRATVEGISYCWRLFTAFLPVCGLPNHYWHC